MKADFDGDRWVLPFNLLLFHSTSSSDNVFKEIVGLIHTLYPADFRRLDLLVKVRFLNPIPPPPFPPKLFDVPTNIHRLGEPAYLDQLASSTLLPMLVDAEMGMALDVNGFDRIWEGNDTGEIIYSRLPVGL